MAGHKACHRWRDSATDRLTVGEPFWIKGGTPIYVKAFLEANHISIPEVESNAQAIRRVDQQIRDGADGIKIFANSIEQDGILTMPADLARDIVARAQRVGKPVGRLTAAHIALTPTLTLWDVESKKFNSPPGEIEQGMNKAAQQLKAFSQAGGQVLFGTDVGYIDRFDSSEEFLWMSRAGMSFQLILASLTTNPAQRFAYSTHSGRIAKGMDADLVILGADPAQDATAFSNVRYTIRDGMIIYLKK